MNISLRILVPCLFLIACGGGDDVPVDSAGGGGCLAVCNDLVLPTVVTKTANPAARPAFTGGTIADGTYAVTSVVDFGTSTPGGTTVREVYRFTGTTIESAVASSEMAEMHFCGTYTTSGSAISLSLTCPMTRTVQLTYTATPTTFSFQHGSDQNEVAFATK